jgi:hypothetical protein
LRGPPLGRYVGTASGTIAGTVIGTVIATVIGTVGAHGAARTAHWSGAEGSASSW